MVEIIKTDWGLASRVGNRIYINKGIENYPTLYKAILKHEYEHSSSMTLKDILMDINNEHLIGVKKEYYSFLLKNPKSLIIFLPIYYHKKRLQIDIAMIMFWLFVITIIGSIIKYT